MKNTWTVCTKCGQYIYKYTSPYTYYSCACMDTIEPRKKNIKKC